MLLNARQIQRVLGKERVILLAIEDITERREIETGLDTARKELPTKSAWQDEHGEYTASDELPTGLLLATDSSQGAPRS